MMEELTHHGYRIGPELSTRCCMAWNAAAC
jgi:hypothetical protein